mgnify:FL=1
MCCNMHTYVRNAGRVICYIRVHNIREVASVHQSVHAENVIVGGSTTTFLRGYQILRSNSRGTKMLNDEQPSAQSLIDAKLYLNHRFGSEFQVIYICRTDTEEYVGAARTKAVPNNLARKGYKVWICS